MKYSFKVPEAFQHIDLRSEGYNVESDMIRNVSAEGLAIEEVPIAVRYDTPNDHKKGALAKSVKEIYFTKKLEL